MEQAIIIAAGCVGGTAGVTGVVLTLVNAQKYTGVCFGLVAVAIACSMIINVVH